jgi:Tol biopolymer transport system component
MLYQFMANDRYVLRLADSSGLRTLPFDGQAFHPSAPLSGTPVYFELAAHGHSEIRAADPISGTSSVAIGSEWNASQPAVSLDGTKLAFVSGESLWVKHADAAPERLAAGQISDPAFFPDGQGLIFAQGRPGSRVIVLRAANGAQQSIGGAGDCFQPAVSPDGGTLAFTCSATGSEQVWIQNLASGMRHRLTEGACNNNAPAWSPDSKSIVFASDCGRGFGLPALYRMTLTY